MSLASSFYPSVAVLDLDLGPGPTGIDLAKALRHELPAIGICLLTSYRDPRLAGRDVPALPLGAIYLCKADIEDIETVVSAIRLLKHAPLTRRSTHFGVSGPTIPLTNLQMEVLLLIGEGISTPEIAQRRGVSAGAIEQTIARICDRLEIPKHAERNQRVQLVQALNRLRGQVNTQ